MIYSGGDGILIRDMEPEGAEVITREEIAQGWDRSTST